MAKKKTTKKKATRKKKTTKKKATKKKATKKKATTKKDPVEDKLTKVDLKNRLNDIREDLVSAYNKGNIADLPAHIRFRYERALTAITRFEVQPELNTVMVDVVCSFVEDVIRDIRDAYNKLKAPRYRAIDVSDEDTKVKTPTSWKDIMDAAEESGLLEEIEKAVTEPDQAPAPMEINVTCSCGEKHTLQAGKTGGGAGKASQIMGVRCRSCHSRFLLECEHPSSQTSEKEQ